MKKWNDFYDYLLPHVPGCPLAMADLQLRMAAQRFCDKTLAWQEDLDAETTIADTIEYDIGITSQQELVQIVSATLDDKPIDVVTKNDLPANWRTSGMTRQGVFTLDKKVFFVVPAPAADLDVVLTVALKPSNTAIGVSDELFAAYADEIASGARSALMLIAKKPYSDAAMGAYWQAYFDGKCGNVAMEVARSHGNSRLRSKASFF